MSRLHRHTEALLRIEIIINQRFRDDIVMLKDDIQREINIALQNDKL